MKTFRYLVLFVILATMLSACAQFFEDYSYAPLGTSSSSSGY
jgi:hypothetical protein